MFSERLLEALKKRNMSGNTLCRIMNIDNKNYSNWKNNKIPRGETIKQIAQILEVSTDWLLEIEEANSPEENRLIDNFRTADDRGKENIICISELEAKRNQHDKLKLYKNLENKESSLQEKIQNINELKPFA